MLSWAVHNGRAAAVKELLSQNAINFDVNDKGEYHMAPLTFAAQEGFTSIVEMLLCHSANPNAQDKRCRTALSYAAQEGHFGVLELLLSHGADPNIIDDEGGTALLWGACRGKEVVVRRLIRVEGIDLNPIDNEGMSPLMWAIERRYGKIAEILANSLPFSKARLVDEVFKWRVLRVKHAGP
jgi:ankyrin repeat protein